MTYYKIIIYLILIAFHFFSFVSCGLKPSTLIPVDQFSNDKPTTLPGQELTGGTIGGSPSPPGNDPPNPDNDPTKLTDQAPDATTNGPLAFSRSEYRLPPKINDDILSAVNTELWASVYHPTNLNAGPYPILLFLHGNHGTCGRATSNPNQRIDDNCQYTKSGTCPSGYIVTPNHNGYDYLSKHLASWGYIVISINANLGITCNSGGSDDKALVLARGKLVLKHLQQLAMWNTNNESTSKVGIDLKGKLDFSNIGLMGHSRGGEGVRAAYNIYRESGSRWPNAISAPLTFKGIFEIAPIDRGSSKIINAEGIPWTVLIPLCDGDVSNFQGLCPFDRKITSASSNISISNQLAQNSVLSVWGANHNFYNTEWQTSDSEGCEKHQALFNPSGYESKNQQQTGLATLSAFFRGNVGNKVDTSYNYNLNPAFKLPKKIRDIAFIDREFVIGIDDSILFLENFSKIFPAGSGGFNHVISSVNFVNQTLSPHDSTRKVGKFSWSSSSSEDHFIQFNIADPIKGIDISLFKSMDISIARAISSLNNQTEPTDFSIRLVFPNNIFSSSVNLSNYLALLGPVGGSGNVRPVLQTAKIKIADFKESNANLKNLVGIQFLFNKTNTGELYIANLRLSNLTLPNIKTALIKLADNNANPRITDKEYIASPTAIKPKIHKGTILQVKKDKKFEVQTNGNEVTKNVIEIELYNEKGFPVTNSLPILVLGKQTSNMGRYPDNGDLHYMKFEISEDEYQKIKEGDSIKLKFGETKSSLQVEFGAFSSSMLSE